MNESTSLTRLLMPISHEGDIWIWTSKPSIFINKIRMVTTITLRRPDHAKIYSRV